MRSAHFTYVLPLAVATVLAACGDSSSPPADGDPTLTIVTAPSGSAVVGERYATPLKVLVRNSRGERAAGVRIWFTTELNNGPQLSFSRPDSSNMGWNSDTTGADGTLTMLVWAGSTTGLAAPVVHVSDIVLADTLPALTIAPGAPAGVRAVTGDTALRVNGSATFHAYVADQWGNQRAEPVTFSSGTPGVVSVTAGGDVAGLAFGRGEVIASYAEFADTIRVSVVPLGRIAAVREWENTGQSEEIVMLDTDGGNLRTLRSCLFFYNRRIAINWEPGHDRLIFADAANCGTGVSTLYRIDEAGATTVLLSSANLGGDPIEWPSYSFDGATIYFTRILGGTGTGARDGWKALANGSSPAIAIPASPSGYGRDIQLASSPDGTRIAFATNRLDLDPFDHKLAMYTIASGDIALLTFSAEGPSWSPDGSQIAFVAGGAVKLVAPDGTGLRTLAPGPGYTSGLGWSPDGKWIIAGGSTTPAGLTLINVESGLTLPLNFDNRLRGPRWKP